MKSRSGTETPAGPSAPTTIGKLVHDHASEQPFTRDMHGVKVPAGIESVVVEAHDLEQGYGGRTVVVDLPGG